MISNERSFKGLLSELGENISSLFRMEVALAKAETSEKLSQVAVAIGAIAGGFVLALAALIVLLQAVVIAVTNAGIPAGWSALIVGVVTAGIALAFVLKGASDLKVKHLSPDRTLDNLQRDAQTIKEHTP